MYDVSSTPLNHCRIYAWRSDSKYGLYHLMWQRQSPFSRQTLYRLREECEKRMRSYTDIQLFSLDVKAPNMAMHININQDMHPIETEFEKWCQSVVIKVKNRCWSNIMD